MVEISENVMQRYVVVRLKSGSNILCKITKVVDGIAITKTNRMGKINCDKIKEIKVIKSEEELFQMKKRFGLY